MGSVREAAFEVARQHGMPTWFGGLHDRDQPLGVDVQLEVTQ
jgi:hypothetical protein